MSGLSRIGPEISVGVYQSQLLAPVPGTAEEVWTIWKVDEQCTTLSQLEVILCFCVRADACSSTGLNPGVKLCYCKTGKRWKQRHVFGFVSNIMAKISKQQQ